MRYQYKERDKSVNYLEEVYRRIFPQDGSVRDQAVARLGQLTMPHWALGDLMDMAVDLAGMTRSLRPPVDRKKIVVMVGDHGVTSEGVSRYPREVTAQMVHNFVNGGAGINALARTGRRRGGGGGHRYGRRPERPGPDRQDHRQKNRPRDGKHRRGTGDEPHARRSVRGGGHRNSGKPCPGTDVFGTGDMGIGNTTPSSAIAAVLTGLDVSLLTGKGTGLDDRQLQHKIAVIQQAIEVNQPDPKDAVDVLAKVGGFEIGAIAGLILGAAAHRKPVVVDGFISTAGALIAYGLEPFVRDYIICSHRSVEPGHRYMHERLGLKPLLDLNLRLGEGTGAALAMNLVDAAARVLTEVATFSEAGISGGSSST
jgi:nicotinate-nucleotide--dimethylbenzimidazole phosphoribosyltransferase